MGNFGSGDQMRKEWEDGIRAVVFARTGTVRGRTGTAEEAAHILADFN